MTAHYNISCAWARALQLLLQLSSMETKQENSALGRGKRWFKEEKAMRYEKREIELQEEVILPSIPFPLLVGCE